jgi:preprotein translocase subunit Sec61beta
MKRHGWTIEFDPAAMLVLCIGIALIVMAIQGGP